MVSAQLKGVLRFYRVTPMGNKVFLFGSDIQALGTGGSSEGAIANSYEKWSMIPTQDRSDKVMQPNDKLEVSFEAAAAGTSDASDGAVVLPLTLNGGSPLVLGKLDNATFWDVKQFGDVALLANQEIALAVRTVREVCVLGSNSQKAFVSVENNA